MPKQDGGVWNLYAFNSSISPSDLPGNSGSVSLVIYGTSVVIASLAVAVFDRDDNCLFQAAPSTSDLKEGASCLFNVPPRADYLKWAIVAARSSTIGLKGDQPYSATVKVRDGNGNALLPASQFSAYIADGNGTDGPIEDGVNFAFAPVAFVSAGKQG